MLRQQLSSLPKIVTRESDTLPESTDEALFSITGGKVRVKEIVGEVTTVIQTQANDTKLKFNPSGTGSDTDICAALDISADAVGTLYTITGDFSDAMKESGGVWAAETDNVMEQMGIVLGPGDIEIDCAATNTGEIEWSVVYEPIDVGAQIHAA